MKVLINVIANIFRTNDSKQFKRIIPRQTKKLLKNKDISPSWAKYHDMETIDAGMENISGTSQKWWRDNTDSTQHGHGKAIYRKRGWSFSFRVANNFNTKDTEQSNCIDVCWNCLGLLFGVLTYILMFFEKNIQKWSKKILTLANIWGGGKSALPQGHLFLPKRPVPIGLRSCQFFFISWT